MVAKCIALNVAIGKLFVHVQLKSLAAVLPLIPNKGQQEGFSIPDSCIDAVGCGHCGFQVYNVKLLCDNKARVFMMIFPCLGDIRAAYFIL